MDESSISHQFQVFPSFVYFHSTSVFFIFLFPFFIYIYLLGKDGNAGMLAYSSSKAAVINMTKVIGKEYAETKITCNCIVPAVVKTDMVR